MSDALSLLDVLPFASAVIRRQFRLSDGYTPPHPEATEALDCVRCTPVDSAEVSVMAKNGTDRPAVCIDTLDYDGAETHDDSIEGEVTRHYYTCPNCQHPVATWMDCPECLWYDEDVWSRTLSERGELA